MDAVTLCTFGPQGFWTLFAFFVYLLLFFILFFFLLFSSFLHILVDESGFYILDLNQ